MSKKPTASASAQLTFNPTAEIPGFNEIAIKVRELADEIELGPTWRLNLLCNEVLMIVHAGEPVDRVRERRCGDGYMVRITCYLSGERTYVIYSESPVSVDANGNKLHALRRIGGSYPWLQKTSNRQVSDLKRVIELIQKVRKGKPEDGTAEKLRRLADRVRPDSDEEITKSLERLSGDASTAQTADPHAPYMPSDWFKNKFGIPAERLRAARRAKRLVAVNKSKVEKRPQYRYSVPNAIDLWPDDGIYLPQS